MALTLMPRALHYIEEVGRAGSIQAASRDLGIAASAILRQITLVEASAGVQLFERQADGMRPTPAGERFIVLARRWRADANGLWSEIKKLQGVDMGHVRLAAMDSQTNGVLPILVARLARDFPKVQLEVEVLSPDAAIAALDDGLAEVALAFNIRPRRDLHVLWLATLPLGCIMAPDHPLAAVGNPTLRDVATHPIAAQSRSLTIRRLLERRHGWLFAADGLPLVTNSLQLLKQVVASGSHVALTSELDAAPEILNGSLLFVPLRDPAITEQSVSVVISANRTLPRIATRVAEALASEVDDQLARVRACAQSPPRKSE